MQAVGQWHRTRPWLGRVRPPLNHHQGADAGATRQEHVDDEPPARVGECAQHLAALSPREAVGPTGMPHESP